MREEPATTDRPAMAALAPTLVNRPGVTYDSCAPLAGCSFPNQDRGIGVFAGRAFQSRGSEYVEICRETVIVHTAIYGEFFPASTMTDEVARATQETINDLDAKIGELTAHRRRLVRELIRLGVDGIRDDSTATEGA